MLVATGLSNNTIPNFLNNYYPFSFLTTPLVVRSIFCSMLITSRKITWIIKFGLIDILIHALILLLIY